MFLVTPNVYAEPTAADMASARAQFGEGRTLREAGKLREALARFQSAYALASTPIIGLELAQTYAALQMPVEARELCFAIDRLPVLRQETVRSSAARQEAGRLGSSLKGQIADLTVKLEVQPPGAPVTLKIDDQEIPEAAFNVARQVNPGAHTLVLEAPNTAPVTTIVSLAPGESKNVPLQITAVKPVPQVVVSEAPKAAAAPHRSLTPPSSHMSPLVPVGGVIAGAGILLGSFAGIVAMVKTSDVKNTCPSHVCTPGVAADAYNAADTWATVSNVSFVVGGVGLVTLLIGVLNPERESVRSTSVQSAHRSKSEQSVAARLFFTTQGGGIYGSF